MKHTFLLSILFLFSPCIIYSQKIKGVITYEKEDGIYHPNLGEKVYLIPCNKCQANNYIYIKTYELQIMMEKATNHLVSIGGNPDSDSKIMSSDSLKYYKQKIDSLISKKRDETTIDGTGNYSFENVLKGKYLLLFECSRYGVWEYSVVEIKGKEIINKDCNFLCFY